MFDRDPLTALVIATGSGADLHSSRPKPIHLLCGRPMLGYVLAGVGELDVSEAVVVTGPSGDWISKRVLEEPPGFPLQFVEHRSVRGSADAALIGLTGLDDLYDDGDLLILPADLPLLGGDTLAAFVEHHRRTGAACTVLTVERPEPDGCDRVLRNRHGRVAGILRDLDLVGDEVAITEVPAGVYCVRRSLLAPAIRRVPADPVDGTHRLIDLVGVLAESGHPVESFLVDDPLAVVPVDSRVQLAETEAVLRRRINLQWMQRGVTMIDPERTYIDVTVSLGPDVTLFPGTMLQGTTTIAEGCEIGPDTRLDRCRIGRESVVEKTMGRLATVGEGCRVGPFAVLEPGTDLDHGTVTGPFYAAGLGE